MNFPSYSILIPAYNAQEFIGNLLDEINNLEVKPEAIYIIDDGSTDGTAAIAKQKNVFVYTLDTNEGKGIALKMGFEIFLEEKKSKYILCMDSDLQHSPGSINDFMVLATQKECAVILGKREISLKNMPWIRYLSNKITSKTISLITSRKIEDSQCGFRLIRGDVLANIDFREYGFQLESEFIFKCVDKNIKMEFVNIPTIYNNSTSSIRHFYDTFKFIRLIIREIYKKWFMKKNVKK